jgi:L-threonylcarbamoyladenylate synthase
MFTVKCTPAIALSGTRSAGALFDELGRIAGKSGVIVYPTETLYALGASADDCDAVAKVFKIKKRDRSLPLSVALPRTEDIGKYAKTSPLSDAISEKFLPGPLTLILKNRMKFSGIIGDTIGIRVPSHPVAIRLVETCGPLTATSANIHGGAEPAVVETARRQIGDGADVYIDGGRCRFARGTTVVDLTKNVPRIVREGAVSADELEECFDAA